MKKKHVILIALPALIFIRCGGGKNNPEDDRSEVKTPVTVTSVSNSEISESIHLNATSSYLRKNVVKSNVVGYIEKVFITTGDFVEAGKPLFTIKTKEADALGKMKDTLFAFKGEITVAAPSSGTVTEIDRQVHDYINDGDQLALLADQSSFVFLLNLPFELNKYATIGTSCSIRLPDSTKLTGTIESKLSTVDAISQTQSYIIKTNSHSVLPENLLAVIELIKSTKSSAQVIQKSAVLSDETMEHFWVMKLINDSTAVKVPVNKGISTDGKIEIVSPLFQPTDRIVSTGNYGLSDTAFVQVLNQ